MIRWMGMIAGESFDKHKKMEQKGWISWVGFIGLRENSVSIV